MFFKEIIKPQNIANYGNQTNILVKFTLVIKNMCISALIFAIDYCFIAVFYTILQSAFCTYRM